MVDKLLIPIGFDLEAAVREAEAKGDKAIRDLHKTFTRQPLVLKVDTKGFAEMGQSIETLKKRLREITAQWDKMPTSAKFDLDSGGKIKQLTADGKALWDELLRINTALEGVGQGLLRFASQSEAASRAQARLADQIREAEIRRYNEASRAKLKEEADDDRRYQKWLANKEKEVRKEQETALRKQQIQDRINEQNAKAAARSVRNDEAIYHINRALRAQEDIIANLNAKLQIYTQRIQGQQVGSEAWNKTALEIRRVAGELERANQQMKDFQQKSFQGLSDSLTKGKVEALTRFREQLRQIEADFNRLNQTGAAYSASGGLTSAANDILRQREAIIKQINQLLTTAADAQLQREKEINAVIEQRKAQQAQIKAQHQAEIAALKQKAAENDRIRKVLAGQENTVANITAKLQIQQRRLETTQIGSGKFEKIAKEVERLTDKLEKAKNKMAEMTGQQTASVNKVTEAIRNQDGYISRLLKRLAVYAGYQQFTNLLTNIRQVTAEFELQRVSLGAIIQDQQKANQIFSEIKAFALKSPLKILDLTKYTKQLAAYRFETDKLFDTTKRLADVSVGLGVDYGRILLAYGQTKAATYLRAAELRQYTEAGIPMLELLAEKFSELEGHMVSTEEVMDKISKRMVTFSMVEDIFKDMTSAGGMFYNMQEKQSQTLYGMWAKMGDAAAVMYEQMGNTATANNAMKEVIQLMSDMMLHWTALANVAQTAAIGFVGYKAAMAGIIPLYSLQNTLTINQIKAEKAKQAAQIKTLAIGRQLTREEQLAVMSKKKLMAADYQRLINEGKLSAAQKISLGRQAATNVQLRRAVLEMGLFTKAQIAALGKMNGWQFFWAKFKLQMQGVGDAFVNLGRTLMAFAPLAAITAVVDLFMDWRQAVAAQEEAIKKVEKQYEETKITLMQIENAYRDIQAAAKNAGESEEEFAKTSYSQKLEQLKKVIKLLAQFGMKNVIDPSVLDYTNIDPVLDNWLAKLNEVNELARSWGREVAQVANAYEGNIFGWSVFGENLKEDMKDLERAWTKLTVNSKFSTALEQLRAIVDEMSNANKGVYDNISKAIGADLKLALGQKRRNESELQYQQRIYKNYQDIESHLQTYLKKGEYKGMLPSLSSEDVSDTLKNFQKEVDEVMHEFDKVKEQFRGKDALSVKMAIDTVAAENDWTEWQKDLLKQHLNEDPITLNAELIPTVNVAGQAAVAEGLKAIITSEFPTLFNENELQSLVSAEGIEDAIKAKLDASTKSLEKSVQLQNNLTYGSKGFENSLKKVKQLQDDITRVENMRTELASLEAIEGEKSEEQLLRQSELQAKLQEIDDASLNSKRAQIAAIVEANAKYDEQIQKQRESAEAEREIAKAALERVTSLGLSDLGKDVKQQFGDLMVDSVKEITDNNYSTDFLISDDELKKVKDVADLYDLWAKNTKAIKDGKEKLVGVGITEATIEKERAELEKKRAQTQLQLSEVEAEITNEKFKGQESEYAKLKLALANATTTEAQRIAQEQLNTFLGDTKKAEFAILMLKREGLKTSLQESLLSQAANEQIADYIKGLDDAENLWKQLGERYNFQLQEKSKKGGSGEDPWILLMKNRMKFMQDFQKGVEDLSKWMGYTKGLADEQENMLGRGLSLKIDSRQLDGTKEELIKWYEDAIGEVRAKIAKLGGKEWEGLGVQMILAKYTKSRVLKKYQELLADMFKELTDFRTEQTQKALEAKLRDLADRIARTRTAKDFYDKILSQTGDIDLAANLSVSLYGTPGEDLKEQIAKQIDKLMQSGEGGIEIGVDVVDSSFDINYKNLRKLTEEAYEAKKIGDQAYKDLIAIANEGEKDVSKMVESWLKATEKAKGYSDKMLDLARTTNAAIAQIETERKAGNITGDYADRQIKEYKDRMAKEQTALAYKAFKDSPMYVQMFDGLDNASTRMLENMKSRMEALKSEWKNLTPAQIKELQSRMNEIDAQLARRNPFKTLSKSIEDYRDLMKNGDARGNKSAKTADADLMATTKAADEARKKYDELIKKYGEGAEESVQEVKDAAEELKEAMSNEEAAQKAVENWKKVKDAIGLSANELFQMLNWAGDIAGAVADISEALGADEEDVQYWNDVASALNEISGGIQDIVESAMSGDVVGIISSVLTAVPKMFVGFSSLFAAGKIRKANKEIRRQADLLEQLEYAYGRLEKAADKVFGRAYLNNYNQQLKNLQAQQAAYLKQAEAERSKGKKADKEKIKDYENQARETADAIKEMQDDLAGHFAGSSRTDVARQMAKSWIDARASMSDTFAAIKGDYAEMIKNMIVEGAAARVIENALTPMWDKMDSMLADNNIEGAIDSLIGGMDSALNAANNGMEVLWKALEARGYDMKRLIGDADTSYTGITRDIAGASEESINGLAVGINTQNYYISQQLEEVRAIRAMMENGGIRTYGADGANVGWTDWQQQAMVRYAAIQQSAADTVVECRRAAQAAEAAVAELRRVITVKGARPGVQVYM